MEDSLSLSVAHSRQFKSLLPAPPPVDATNKSEPNQSQSEVTDPMPDDQAQGDPAPARATEPQPPAEPCGGGTTGRACCSTTCQACAAASDPSGWRRGAGKHE